MLYNFPSRSALSALSVSKLDESLAWQVQILSTRLPITRHGLSACQPKVVGRLCGFVDMNTGMCAC